MDPLPQELPKTDIVTLSGIIATRADKINPKIFDKLLIAVKNRGLHALSTQAGHVILASTTEVDGAAVNVASEENRNMKKSVMPLTPKRLQTIYND
jgi:hypothetical protein